jgi:methionyl-tRNA formyltransferase
VRGSRSSCANPPDRAFLRLIFAGTSEFAERALAALIAAGHDVALVLTQPDRLAGRGLRARASPVKRLALAHRIEIFQPATLKSVDVSERLLSIKASALVVAAYGLLLPDAVLSATGSALNIHASLLPRWRGAAPIQRSILAGDRETGVSIMQMDAGLDTGPVLAQSSLAIAGDDDAGTLHDKLAALGARMIVEVLAEVAAGRAHAEPQPSTGATYAAKIDKRETVLDWRAAASELERAVRAFRPSPGAQASIAGAPLKVWRAAVLDGHGEPGTLLHADEALVVACGKAALAITEVQRAGGRCMPAREFIRGHRIAPGTRFDLAR